MPRRTQVDFGSLLGKIFFVSIYYNRKSIHCYNYDFWKEIHHVYLALFLSLSLCFEDQGAVLEMGQEMFYSHDRVSPDVGRY